MAIPAVDADSTNMVLMAEGHRLRDRHTNIGPKWRTYKAPNNNGGAGEDEHGGINGQSGECVRAAVKDLRHGSPVHLCNLIVGAGKSVHGGFQRRSEVQRGEAEGARVAGSRL